MNIQKFDKYLSENTVQVSWAIMHPSVWNGYWSIRHRHNFVKVLFKWLGKKLHNKYIYWVGLPIEWMDGVKEHKEFFSGWSEPVEIDLEEIL